MTKSKHCGRCRLSAICLTWPGKIQILECPYCHRIRVAMLRGTTAAPPGLYWAHSRWFSHWTPGEIIALRDRCERNDGEISFFSDTVACDSDECVEERMSDRVDRWQRKAREEWKK
jgi:hypothetical protein